MVSACPELSTVASSTNSVTYTLGDTRRPRSMIRMSDSLISNVARPLPAVMPRMAVTGLAVADPILTTLCIL